MTTDVSDRVELPEAVFRLWNVFCNQIAVAWVADGVMPDDVGDAQIFLRDDGGLDLCILGPDGRACGMVVPSGQWNWRQHEPGNN